MSNVKGVSSLTSNNTDDLCRALERDSGLDDYLRDHRDLLIRLDVPALIAGLYQTWSLSKAELARRSGMSEVYLHQVFAGRRNPSRDRLICLCISLDATLEETQDLLKKAAFAQLYPKVRRDAVIIHGILHHSTPEQINDKLFAEDEKTLS